MIRICDRLSQQLRDIVASCSFESQSLTNDQLMFAFLPQERQRYVLCREQSFINGQLYGRELIKLGLLV